MLAIEDIHVEKYMQERSRLSQALLTAFRDNTHTVTARLLEKVVAVGVNNPDLWHCRRFFYELPKAVLYKSPLLMAGMVILYCLSHKPVQANEWLERLRTLSPMSEGPKKQIANLLASLKILMLRADTKKPLSLLRDMARGVHDGTLQPLPCSLTANSPSIYNGLFDLSRYSKHFSMLHQPMEAVFAVLYGDMAQVAVDIMQAEISYQQNKQIEAFSLATAAVNILSRTEGGADMLFTATFILIEAFCSTGQLKANESVLLNTRDKLITMGAFHLLPNVKALHVWVWLYHYDRERVEHWLKHEAPDEYGDYNKLDNFAYFVKLRVYLALGHYLSALGLAERIRPVLQECNRPMYLCELDILLSMVCTKLGEHGQAMACLDRCLPLGEKYGYYRLFADEGELFYSVLLRYMRYKKTLKTPFLSKVMELTQEVALQYPGYLNLDRGKVPQLTKKQIAALRLAAGHYSNAQIAAHMRVSQGSVTGYFRRIFAALGVSKRHRAVEIAKHRGLLP